MINAAAGGRIITTRKIALVAVAALVGLSALAYSAVWLLGERLIARRYHTPAI